VKCEDCRWFSNDADHVKGPGGECRLRAPRAALEAGCSVAVWPPVRPEDFCGDYEQRRD